MPQLYLIEIPLPSDSTEIFMEGLEEFADSMSCFEGDSAEDWKLLIYTQEKPDIPYFENVLDGLAKSESIKIPSYNLSEVEETDWVAESQKNFESVEAGKFFIYPLWRKEEIPNDSIPIEIDPQRAFGTGGHETTKGCLLAMQGMPGDFPNILDMGCGSGILAIAAAKLWKDSKITAVDIDPICVETATQNAKINNVLDMLTIEESDGYDSNIVKNNAVYDLIISNILAKPLIDFAPKAKSVLRKGGYLILAGSLTRQAGDVIAAHEKQGLKLIDRQNINDWSILTMQG